jgi:hypothetical protein
MTEKIRIGILGLDTSHCVAFADHLLNNYSQFDLAAAWPGGSERIPVSRNRLSGFVQQMADRGISILETPEQVAEQSDAIWILSLDGNCHRELFERVARPGLRIFFDKPMADRVDDAEAIFKLADQMGVRVFSASALRFVSPLRPLLENAGGPLEVRLTASLNEQEGVPTYHFYGIHATELLVEALGADWDTLESIDSEALEFRIGWRAGHRAHLSFRKEPVPFALTVGSGAKEQHCSDLLEADRPIYAPLLREIASFMETGTVPVSAESTLAALRLLVQLASR